MTSHVARYAQRRMTRKLIRVFPVLGAFAAAVTVGAAIRRKGVVNGAVDTVLDFTPVVGFVKNAIEIVRGEDLIADRPARPGPLRAARR